MRVRQRVPAALQVRMTHVDVRYDLSQPVDGGAEIAAEIGSDPSIAAAHLGSSGGDPSHERVAGERVPQVVQADVRDLGVVGRECGG